MGLVAPSETADYGTTTVSAQADDRTGRSPYDRVMQMRLSTEQLEWIARRAKMLNVTQAAVVRHAIDAQMVESFTDRERLTRAVREALDQEDYEEAADLSAQLAALDEP